MDYHHAHLDCQTRGGLDMGADGRSFLRYAWALSRAVIGLGSLNLVERADLLIATINADPTPISAEKMRAIFLKHFITCFIEDNFGSAKISVHERKNMVLEADYPHSDAPGRIHGRNPLGA